MCCSARFHFELAKIGFVFGLAAMRASDGEGGLKDRGREKRESVGNRVCSQLLSMPQGNAQCCKAHPR